MKGFIKDIDCKECNDCCKVIEIEEKQCPNCGGESFASLYFCGICQHSMTRGDEAREHYKDHFKGYKK